MQDFLTSGWKALKKGYYSKQRYLPSANKFHLTAELQNICYVLAQNLKS